MLDAAEATQRKCMGELGPALYQSLLGSIEDILASGAENVSRADV